eukprot:TRINITY_DN11537_c0_g1_i1.p1 TRINITY_DN11537_c0_g1~~TRINITY_DN11537_c0_g1_i1.p1  ORF type:complete len:830 (+),score=150.22 TRINITY_DN11537_c0_g1_i1:268-2757(+)
MPFIIRSQQQPNLSSLQMQRRGSHSQDGSEEDRLLHNRAVLFDANYVEVIESNDSLGALLIGSKPMRFVRRRIYRWIYLPLFAAWFSAFPTYFALMIKSAASPHERDQQLERVAQGLMVCGILHQSMMLSLLNQRLLWATMQCFETNFLILVCFLEAIAYVDQVGWDHTNALFFCLMGISQLDAILADALHDRFAGFDKAWDRMLEMRRKIETMHGRMNKSHAGKGIQSQKMHVIESQDDAQNSSHEPNQNDQRDDANHDAAKDARNPLPLTKETCHLLAASINSLIEPQDDWSLWQRLKWRIKLGMLFGRKDLLIGYATGFLTSLWIYWVVVSASIPLPHKRMVHFIGLTWNPSEVFRSTSITSVIFYLKRILSFALHPLNVTTIQMYQILIPCVPEIRAIERFSSYQERYGPVHVAEMNSEPHQMAVKPFCEEVRNDHLPMPSQERAQPRPEREKIILLSSSGIGSMVDAKKSISEQLFGPKFAGYCRQYVYHATNVIIFLWIVIFIMYITSQMIHDDVMGMVLSPLGGIVLLSMFLQWMDNTFEASVLCLLNFECVYLLCNTLGAFISSATLVKDGSSYGITTLASMAAIAWSVILLDAKPISFRQFSQSFTLFLSEWNHIYTKRGSFLRDIFKHSYLCMSYFTIHNRQGHLDQDPNHNSERNDRESSNEANVQTSRLPSSLSSNPTICRLTEPTARNFVSVSQARNSVSIVSPQRSFRRHINFEALTMDMFSNRKGFYIIVSLFLLLSFYIFVELLDRDDMKVSTLYLLGGSWENYAILRFNLMNLCIFMAKRAGIHFRRPYYCMSITKPLLRIPMSKKILDLMS